MNYTTLILNFGIVCILAIALTFAGCTDTGDKGSQMPPRTPVGTPIPVSHLVVTEEQNTATIYVNQSNVITVKLEENPTTGYQWNLTTTPGLQVMSDTYMPSDTTGKLVGSGGTHVWDISAIAPGEQKIDAVYKRSWETVTGNETRFSMTVVVS